MGISSAPPASSGWLLGNLDQRICQSASGDHGFWILAVQARGCAAQVRIGIAVSPGDRGRTADCGLSFPFFHGVGVEVREERDTDKERQRTEGRDVMFALLIAVVMCDGMQEQEQGQGQDQEQEQGQEQEQVKLGSLHGDWMRAKICFFFFACRFAKPAGGLLSCKCWAHLNLQT